MTSNLNQRGGAGASLGGALGESNREGEGWTLVVSRRQRKKAGHPPRVSAGGAVRGKQTAGNASYGRFEILGDQREVDSCDEDRGYTHARKSVETEKWQTVTRKYKRTRDGMETRRASKVHGQRRTKTPIPARPSVHQIRSRVGKDATERVMVWGQGDLPVPQFWARLRMCCGPRIASRIIKVTRHNESQDLRRFEIYCRPYDCSNVLRACRENQGKWGWYVRRHTAARVFTRLLQEAKRPQSEVPQKGVGTQRNELRLGTLNVNGVRNKKADLQRLLEKRSLDCIALQETLLKATDWRLNVPGYRSYAVYGDGRDSRRGVAILLKNTIGAQTVGTSSPWHTFVRCFGLSAPVIVGTVYIPTTKRMGKTPLRTVRRQMEELRVKYPLDSIILMGDFNRTNTQVERWFNNLPDSVKVVPNRHKDAKRGTRKGKSARKIDHIVTYMAHQDDSIAKSRILRSFDMSDHYPVTSVYTCKRAENVDFEGGGNASMGVPNTVKTGWSRKIKSTEVPIPGSYWYNKGGARGKANHVSMINANYWAPLLELIEEGADESLSRLDRQAVADAAASKMVDVIHRVAEDHGLVRKVRSTATPPLKRQIAQAIDRRGKLHRYARRERGDAEQQAAAWTRYGEAKVQTKRLINADRRSRWVKALNTAAGQMRTDPKAFWRFTSSVAGWKRKDSNGGSQPVKHPDSGELLTGEAEIGEAWKTHYERLAADVTGNSRKPDKWADLWSASPKRRHLQELDGKITLEEMVESLKHLKRHKAPGKDGIPADFLKLAADETSAESPMGKALLEMLNLMWEHQMIPQEWRDSMVVSIPKKGDVTDMNNYRGISLMSTVLKVLVTIVSARLDKGFESNGLFSEAQAGFRRREECVTQAACLLEISKRRKIKGLPTYLMFVDLKKAYDTVPQEALMAKLDAYGVRGKMLSFIRELYSNSTIAVRNGDNLSESFCLNRGVRQGCPLSPILFNIFINDILDGTRKLGVPTPGVDGEKTSRVPGLLFADDLVAITPNKAKLAKMGDHLTQWLETNEMTAGIHKCGVMAIGRKTSKLERTPDRWKIAGENLPIVRTYGYLGMNFNKKLDVRAMMAGKVESAGVLVDRMLPFLRSRAMPVSMKVAVVRGVILPRLLFGAEVFGMKKEITHAMQVQINKALRLTAGMGARTTASNVAIWRELKIPPICASAAARRARALQKAASLRTVVARVVSTNFKSRCWTWSTGTHRWLNRYVHRLAAHVPPHQERISYVRGEWKEAEPKALSLQTEYLVWRREERIYRKAKTGQWYIKSNFDKMSLSGIRSAIYPRLAQGIAMIITCRVGGFWCAGRLARRGLIPDGWKRKCPCCKERVVEDLAHILFDCNNWKVGRERLLSPLITEAKAIMAKANSSDTEHKVALLLGGEYNGSAALKSWKKPVKHGELNSDEETEEIQDGMMRSPRVLEHGHLRVASFLVWMMASRRLVIEALGPGPNSQSPSVDLRPNG